MAEAATTRPSRARKAAPAKAAPAKAAATTAPAKAEAAKTDVDRFTVELVHHSTTKSYERFDAPENMKGVVVGSMYGPIGTTRIGVVVIGAESPAAE